MCILLIRDGEYPRSKDWQGDNVLAEGIKINRQKECYVRAGVCNP